MRTRSTCRCTGSGRGGSEAETEEVKRTKENAVDLERVYEVALEEGVALEVNGLPARLDLSGSRAAWVPKWG